ncbi:YdeI/OmpD-associated family protein [Chitinophaga lutea]
MTGKFSSLKRDTYPMPDFVAEALENEGLFEKYERRPPYQQNDYIGWITRAKREETRQKRLRQMLDELKQGGVYMNMKYNGE